MKRPNLARLGIFPLLFVSLFSSLALAGDAQWTEVRSPNFRVYTDAGEKRGREAALRFEQMRFVFGQLFQKTKVQTGVPIRVIAFRNSKEFRTVSPLWKGKPREDVSGLFVKGHAVAFVALDLSAPDPWSVVFHEYAHMLLTSNTSSTPLWFDEGFAEYFSTIKIGKNEWVVGTFPEYAPQQLGMSKFIPLVQLFSASQNSPLYNEENHASMFYAESWLAVEYFWADPERQKQLVRYTELIQQKVPVADAMKSAFGKEPAQLDKDFENYFRGGRAFIHRYKKPPAIDAVEMKAATIDDISARAVAAEMRLNEPDYSQQATTELESILQQKPDQPVALLALGYGAVRANDFEKAQAYLEKAAALDPDDPRVYFYLALALENNAGRLSGDSRKKMQAALEKCVALDPEMSEAYGLLAFVQGADGKYDEAEATMKKAIALSPRTYENYLNLASLYLNRGKLGEAAGIAKQLTGVSNERVAAEARNMLERVNQMKTVRAALDEGRADPSRSQKPQVIELAEDYELKSFAGKLVKVDCPTKEKIVITVATGENTLVLSALTKEVSLGGKPLYCDLKGVNVHGYYYEKPSKVVGLTIE